MRSQGDGGPGLEGGLSPAGWPARPRTPTPTPTPDLRARGSGLRRPAGAGLADSWPPARGCMAHLAPPPPRGRPGRRCWKRILPGAEGLLSVRDREGAALRREAASPGKGLRPRSGAIAAAAAGKAEAPRWTRGATLVSRPGASAGFPGVGWGGRVRVAARTRLPHRRRRARAMERTHGHRTLSHTSAPS